MFTQKTVDLIEKAFVNAIPDVERFKAVFDSATEEELICLKYYYAFMPVSDLATYDASLFLEIIRQTLKVHKLNLYNTQLPDDIFLNFVLHYRVNNENIEYNREIFFDELYPRIKDKSMYDAALEVNYWCLEKATYTPTNPRTVSPLTIIRNAKGRCGEESTFTVSALRSVGIPARQIYTPRWAHCDSNHAWVEVYIEGKWHFLGACEPEPKLDRGWFTGPAARGMLMHTRVFSNIVFNEEVTYSNESFAELNLTSHYAESAKLTIKILNTNGKSVKVRFEVPNYCELYPIATLETDADGLVSITTGLGDIQLHITDGERFLTYKADVREEKNIVLDFAEAVAFELADKIIKFVPPAGKAENNDSFADEEHEAKIQNCTRVRSAFESTFVDEEKGTVIAKNYPGFQDDVLNCLINAKGNHAEIKAFLDMDNGIPFKYKVLLLKAIASKDLTDSTSEMLTDHLKSAYSYRDYFYEELYKKYVLNPRVHLEMLHPYREYIDNYFDTETKSLFRENPRRIYDFIIKNIEDYTEADYKTLIASTTGTLQIKKGSINSKKVLFVAICRTLGIPARCNPSDGELEYYWLDKWERIVPYEAKETVKLSLTCQEKLQYSKNFSIARLINGAYQTLSLWGNEGNEFELEEGSYRILTGQRLADGSMLMNFYFIELLKGKEITFNVEIPKEDSKMDSLPVNDHRINTKTGSLNLDEILPERFNITAYVEPSKEPTEHLFRELLQEIDDIKAKNVGLVLITSGTNPTLEKVINAFPELVLIEAADSSFADSMLQQFGLPAGTYPVQALIAKEQTGLMALHYYSGYHVGSVSLMLKNI